MKYYSDDRQDEFVANILAFKKNGWYVDIGSGASVGSNNTYFFESLGWKGICIDKASIFDSSYEQRTCHYINGDALTIDYKQLFEEKKMPSIIDYLSLDVDEYSTEVLERLPLKKYKFRVITIEHDSHFFGDVFKNRQREILKQHGYRLLCTDVLNQSGRNIGQEHAWEDWWVHPEFFEEEKLDKLRSYRENTEQIIQKFS